MEGYLPHKRQRALVSLGLALTSLVLLEAQTTPPFTTIDYPGAASTLAWAINNKGDVAGGYIMANGARHGFLWSGGHLSSIDFPGAANTEVFGLNDTGDIAGDYYNTSGFTHGFVFSRGRYITVDVPGAGPPLWPELTTAVR